MKKNPLNPRLAWVVLQRIRTGLIQDIFPIIQSIYADFIIFCTVNEIWITINRIHTVKVSQDMRMKVAILSYYKQLVKHLPV